MRKPSSNSKQCHVREFRGKKLLLFKTFQNITGSSTNTLQSPGQCYEEKS